MYKTNRCPLKPVLTGPMLAYDFETTGLSSISDQITQIGAATLNEDLKKIETLNIIVRPRLDVIAHPIAAITTMISLNRQHDGLTERDAIKQLLNLASKSNSKYMLGYNNIRFDSKVLSNAAYRNLAAPDPQKIGLVQLDVFNLVLLTHALRKNTLKISKKDDGKPNLKLESICNNNDIKLTNAHDALADVEATYKLAELIKIKEPALYQHWLNLSNPNNIDKITNFAEIVFFCSTAFGSSTRYTRPMMVTNNKEKSGGYLLDLTLDFDITEKHLFQKYNKFNSPCISEITTTQGDRLLTDLNFEPEHIKAAIEKAEKTDLKELFEKWQEHHKKEPRDWGNDLYQTSFDKFTVIELFQIKDSVHLETQNLLKTKPPEGRIGELLERICAFQLNEHSNISENCAKYITSKLPENNKETKQRMDEMDTMINDKSLTKDKRLLLEELKEFSERQIKTWRTISITD